jgi:RNA polymerase sigma-70 factor (ECF subfamily)
MEKLEEVFLRYGKVMLYSANKMLGDMSLAEDAVQNVFLTIAKHPDRVLSIPIDDLKPYLIVVCENAARKIYKAHHKFQEIPLEEAELFDSDKSDKEDLTLERISLTNILNMPQMTSQFRDVIILKYYYDMDTRSIAKALNISGSNVRARLTRARNLIFELLKNEGFGNE